MLIFVGLPLLPTKAEDLPWGKGTGLGDVYQRGEK